MKGYIPITEAAMILKKSPGTIRRYIREGQILTDSTGKLIDSYSLVLFIQNQKRQEFLKNIREEYFKALKAKQRSDKK